MLLLNYINFENTQIILWLSLFLALYFYGLLNCIFSYNKNLITFLISSEIMFLGLDLGFIGVSLMFNHPAGIIYSFLILMLTVGESAVGLGLCISCLKLKENINFTDINTLKL